MLLQSYSGTIRLFPAVPADWNNISFKTLRAEGAFLVSAERKDGLAQSVTIISEKGGICRLENPFEKNQYELKGAAKNAVGRDGNDLIIKTSVGQKITLIHKP